MEEILHIDFETRSRVNLIKHGLARYATDESTDIICLAYGYEKDGVVVHRPQGVSKWVLDYVASGGIIGAWNASFEIWVWNHVGVRRYGWPELKVSQCRDIMAWAGANNVPQALGDAAVFMNVEAQKDKRGKQLISLLCSPNGDDEFNEDPNLIQEMLAYCADDVRAEIDVAHALRPLDHAEQKVWEATMNLNIRGIPVNEVELSHAIQACKDVKATLNDEMQKLTGGLMATQREAILTHLRSLGADLPDVKTETLENFMEAYEPITPEQENIARIISLRMEGGKTSTSKYQKMFDIQYGNSIKNVFRYHGASTGRFSAVGLNAQNFPRPLLKEQEQIDEAAVRVFGGHGGTMTELVSCLRNAITAPKGYTFVDCDFSSIENRVSAFVSGQKDIVTKFAGKDKFDEYKEFAASSLYHVDIADVTKDQRQVAKSAVLGCMYGQGPKGLVEYAKGMGVTLTLGQSEEAVEAYRKKYAKVKKAWFDINDVLLDTVLSGAPTAWREVKFKVQNNVLWVKLPSGRLLAYQRPEVREVETPWGEMKPAVFYHGQNTHTRKWQMNHLRGSLMFQNIVQAIARDMLVDSWLQLEDHPQAEPVMLVHDEIMCLAKEGDATKVEQDMLRIMSTPPEWASDFPLAAESWIAKTYRK